MLNYRSQAFPISSGMYFSVPGGVQISGMGTGVLISQTGYSGLFTLGGPIEQIGRLHYIDGCSDTLLIPPTIKGDACLNLLYLPPGTTQTMHTHPSFRFGMIVDGSGFCDDGTDPEPLHSGKIFFIAPNGKHRFRTMDEPLRVIAFHPDSDFGPHHDDHPMINRTMVNGASAATLTHQQRKINHSL